MRFKKKFMLIFSIVLIFAAGMLILFSAGVTTPSSENSGKALHWLVGQQNPNTGLLDSYGNTNNRWGGDYNDGNIGYLYDQALAVISFTHAGLFKNARLILNGLMYLQYNDGSWYDGFRVNADIRVPNDSIVTQRRRYVGANSFVIIAILHYTLITGDTTYTHNAELCADWIISQQVANEHDLNYGAVKGGIEWDRLNDSEPPVYADWLSTESNADAYAALKLLGVYFNNNNYIQKAAMIKRWVFNRVWYNYESRFYTGSNDSSQVLDAQTFPFLALYKDSSAEERNKLERAINWIMRNLIENFSYMGVDFTGASFGGRVGWYHQTNGILPTNIWWEGTAQLARVFDILNNTGQKIFFLNELYKLQENSEGIPYSFTLSNSMYEWPYNLPFNSVAATSWFYFAENSINPFSPLQAIDDFEYGDENEYRFASVLGHGWAITPSINKKTVKVIKEPNTNNHILSLAGNGRSRIKLEISRRINNISDKSSIIFKVKNADFPDGMGFKIFIGARDADNIRYNITLHPQTGNNSSHENHYEGRGTDYTVRYIDLWMGNGNAGYMDGQWHLVNINAAKVMGEYFPGSGPFYIQKIGFEGRCYVDNILIAE